MELFRNVNVDWLGKKWYFLGFSLIFSIAGIISMASTGRTSAALFRSASTFGRHAGPGAIYQNRRITNQIRQATEAAGIKDASIRSYGTSGSNEMLISLAGAAR